MKPLTLDTPVSVYEADAIEGKELVEILSKIAGLSEDTAGDLHIAIIGDKTPLAARERLVESLKNLCHAVYFDRTAPNPQTADIMAMFEEPAFAGTDLVLGIGGGSVLDSAKALAMLAVHSGGADAGSLDDYLGPHAKLAVQKPSLPLVLIPTTAGTGSEVTKVGVYTSKEGRKYTLGSPLMMAKCAVLSGSFLEGIPPALCAATGFDALDHALESIWNKNANPQTREIACKAAVEVLTWLPRAYRNAVLALKGEKTEDAVMVNRMMLRASCMAGTAFTVTGTGAGHALSFVLSEEWHVPHGTACAFTLPELFDLSAAGEDTAPCLEQIARALFPSEPEPGIDSLRNLIGSLMEEMKMPKSFNDLGINLAAKDIDLYFDRAFSDPKMLNHLPIASKENIYPILEGKC